MNHFNEAPPSLEIKKKVSAGTPVDILKPPGRTSESKSRQITHISQPTESILHTNVVSAKSKTSSNSENKKSSSDQNASDSDTPSCFIDTQHRIKKKKAAPKSKIIDRLTSVKIPETIAPITDNNSNMDIDDSNSETIDFDDLNAGNTSYYTQGQGIMQSQSPNRNLSDQILDASKHDQNITVISKSIVSASFDIVHNITKVEIIKFRDAIKVCKLNKQEVNRESWFATNTLNAVMEIFKSQGYKSKQQFYDTDDDTFFETILKTIVKESISFPVDVEAFEWSELKSEETITKDSIRLK